MFMCQICIFYTIDGEGLTFVLDRFDPGGGGTISCSGLTPGDISVPFEVRLTKGFLYPIDKLIYHMYMYIYLQMHILLCLKMHISFIFHFIWTDVWKHKRKPSWFTKWLFQCSQGKDFLWKIRNSDICISFWWIKFKNYINDTLTLKTCAKMWSILNNLFPIRFQRLCTVKDVCFGATNVIILFIEIYVIFYSFFSRRLVVKTQ